MNTSKVSVLKYLISFTVVLLMSSVSAFAQLDEPSGINSQFYYSGSLDAIEKIELNMQVNGYNVSGSYMITSNGEIFIFKGRLAADKTGMGVLVYDEGNNYVASIEARVISQELDFASKIKGTWKPVNGGRNKSISLNKVAEFADSGQESERSYFE